MAATGSFVTCAASHLRWPAAAQEMAPRYGSLVDIHGHFLAGERSWLTGIIEPSLEGASEVRVEWQLDTLVHQSLGTQDD